MLWTIGTVYTLAWLASPWIVTGLTFSLGSALFKTGTSAAIYTGKGVYYLMTGSSGYLATSDDAMSKDDAWVVLDNPTALCDTRYPGRLASYGHPLRRRKRHMSI